MTLRTRGMALFAAAFASLGAPATSAGCASYEPAGRIASNTVVVEDVGDTAALETRADGTTVVVAPRSSPNGSDAPPSRIDVAVIDVAGVARRFDLAVPRALAARKRGIVGLTAHLVEDGVALVWVERDVTTEADGSTRTVSRLRVAFAGRAGQEADAQLAECQSCILQSGAIETPNGLLVVHAERGTGPSSAQATASLAEIDPTGRVLRSAPAPFLLVSRGGGLGVSPSEVGSLVLERGPTASSWAVRDSRAAWVVDASFSVVREAIAAPSSGLVAWTSDGGAAVIAPSLPREGAGEPVGIGFDLLFTLFDGAGNARGAAQRIGSGSFLHAMATARDGYGVVFSEAGRRYLVVLDLQGKKSGADVPFSPPAEVGDASDVAPQIRPRSDALLASDATHFVHYAIEGGAVRRREISFAP